MLHITKNKGKPDDNSDGNKKSGEGTSKGREKDKSTAFHRPPEGHAKVLNEAGLNNY